VFGAKEIPFIKIIIMRIIFLMIVAFVLFESHITAQTLVPDAEITLVSGPNNPFVGTNGFTIGAGATNTYIISFNEIKYINSFHWTSNFQPTGSSMSFSFYSAPSNLGPWQLITTNTSTVVLGLQPPKSIGKAFRFMKVVMTNNATFSSTNFNTFDFYESDLISSNGSTVLQNNCITLTSIASGETYQWSTGETSQSIQVCTSGVYTVNVTNSGFTGNQDHTASISVSTLGTLDSLYGPNGQVYSVFRNGNTVYYGGDFNAVGPITGSGASIDNTSGLANLNLPRVDGTLNVVIPDGNGGWYVGGNFTRIGTHLRNHAAHINPNGSLDLMFNPNPNGEVFSLAVSGSYLYIGGAFTTIQGTANNYMAKVLKNTGSPVFWSVNTNGAVRSIVLFEDKLLLGGNFTSLGGAIRNYLGAVDTTFLQATTWNPNPNAAVFKLYLNGTKLYAGGDFTTVTATSKQYGCGFTLPGFTLDGYNMGANGRITDFVLNGSVIYVCGQFTTIGGASRNYLAALSSINAVANTFNPSPNGVVRSLALSNGNLVVGGYFSIIAGVNRNRLAMLNISTVTATAWDPNVMGLKNTTYFVNCLAVDGSRIYAGGLFYSVGAVTRNNLAAYDESTGQLLSWNPNINGIVRAIVADNNYVYIGGDFTTVNGSILKNRIAQLNVGNGLPTGWNPNADGVVNALNLQGSTLYVGGNFANIGGSARSKIAGINTLTGAATTFNPTANGEVFAFTTGANTLFVGGAFTTISGQTRNRVAGYDLATEMLAAFNPNANNTVYALAHGNNLLYMGGLFTTMAGQTRLNMAALNTQTNGLSSFNPFPATSALVYSLCAQDTNVYRGGTHSFENQNQPIVNLSAHSLNSPSPTYWQPNPSDYVRSMAISNSKLYVGGNFKTINNRFQPYFASIDVFSSLLPAISSLSNDTICMGQTVSVSGTGLSNVTGVSVGGVTVPFTVTSNTAMQLSPNLPVNGIITLSSGATSITTSQSLIALAMPSTPTITASGPTTICTGGTVTLTSSSATGNTWSNGLTSQSIVVSSAGTYSVTVSNGACTTTSAPTVVNVVSVPLVPTVAASGPTTICTGGTVTLTSSSATGNTWSNGLTSQSIVVSSAGTYSVTVSNGTCSTTSAPTVVSVVSSPAVPTVTASGPTSICSGSTITLTSSSATGNTWSNGLSSQSIVVGTAGLYSVSVSNGSCSSSSLPIAINVLASPPVPTISSNGPTTICSGNSVVLTSSSASGNVWSNGSTSQSINVVASGLYNVVVSDGTCSTSSGSVDIVVLTPPAVPVITASGSTALCPGSSVVLTSSSSSGNTWSNGFTSPSITVSNPGVYSVSVSNGACSTTSSNVAVTSLSNTSSTLNINALDIYFLNGQTYTQSGTYAQVIPNSVGCDSLITLNLTLSFTELSEQAETLYNVSIYPNPAASHITIALPTADSYDIPVQLVNVQGEIIWKGKLNDQITNVNISNLASGVYYVQMQQFAFQDRIIKIPE
jgi:hypothetical protein